MFIQNSVLTQVTGPTSLIDALTRTPTFAERRDHLLSEGRRRAFFAKSRRLAEFRYQALDLTERRLDFNLVVPEPRTIHQGPCCEDHANGVTCWRTWRLDHWGTQQNGTDLEIIQCDDDAVDIRFETLGSHPFALICELSRRVRDYELEVAYADENLGTNLGQYTIDRGEVIEELEFAEGTPEALDFAARLRTGWSYDALLADADLDRDWEQLHS